MPRYKGLSMPRPKKKKIEQSNPPVENPPAPPPAPEPADPPTPEQKVVKRGRPPQSPGMKVVKAAAYVARKAKRVAQQAHLLFLKASSIFVTPVTFQSLMCP